ncbi:hypothetical protein QC761_0107500 [Podospora bellae-mahoneyi]|uniref:Transporter n=1 Tax=Podospora bellae-mahoneyi TaxID=2093777 RepID=A0ABR0F5W6_9PEZI|nr:hypothetical protein QC761_0107500 [Podospora bellae-mahoneyi]
MNTYRHYGAEELEEDKSLPTNLVRSMSSLLILRLAPRKLAQTLDKGTFQGVLLLYLMVVVVVSLVGRI